MLAFNILMDHLEFFLSCLCLFIIVCFLSVEPYHTNIIMNASHTRKLEIQVALKFLLLQNVDYSRFIIGLILQFESTLASPSLHDHEGSIEALKIFGTGEIFCMR